MTRRRVSTAGGSDDVGRAGGIARKRGRVGDQTNSCACDSEGLRVRAREIQQRQEHRGRVFVATKQVEWTPFSIVIPTL
jgi:hypothetical protein